MEDIERDWDTPLAKAGIAAKASVVVRVGMLDLGAGTGSFRVREMMNRIAYPLGVYVRADVNLTDIEATCTDGKRRITEVIDLPTTGVNTERIWLLEHFADWFNVNLGKTSIYHARSTISQELLRNLGSPAARTSAMHAVKLAERRRLLDKEDQWAHSLEAASAESEERHSSVFGEVVTSAQTPESNQKQMTQAEPAVAARTSDGPDAESSAARPASAQSSSVVFDSDAASAPSAAPASSDEPDEPTPEPSTVRSATERSAQPTSGSDQQQQHTVPAPGQHKPPKGEYAEHFDHIGRKPSPTSDGITVRQAHERLDLIERRAPLYGPAVAGLASACACAAFVFLLGGGPYDMLGAFVGAGLGHWVRRLLFARRLNQYFVTFVSVALAALACTAILRLVGLIDPVALQHDTAYIGAMLFVIPGFPLITGGLDIAKIDFPSGIQRLCYTLSIILMATLAGWMVATLVHLNPQGFEPLGLNPFVNAGLRFIAAFVGVWGFSVMFNSPQRMCFTAAFIGAITDTLRLTIIDLGVPPEAGAFIGAFLAGMLAFAWRSSVRRGWLAPYLGYPRICLTVPSIVIMVPGLYMYQAMFHLGQFDTLQALDWGFRAFMVIICLPIGLAMARVVTDKNWRYDV